MAVCRGPLLLPAVSQSGVGWHDFLRRGKAGTAPAAQCGAGTGMVAHATGTAHVCCIEQLQLILPGSFGLAG